MAETVIITGFHAVTSALEQAPERVLEVYLESGNSRDSKKRGEVRALASSHDIPSEERSSRFFKDRGKGRNTQGLAARL